MSRSGESDFARYVSTRIESAKKIETVDDGLIYYDGSSVTKIGKTANVRWSYIVGANADFRATDAGVASWVGSKLTLIDGSNGTPGYSGNLESGILSAVMGSQYSAALLEPEHGGTIILMENNGRRVDTIDMSDQTVIDYGFFYNDTLFWVMTLDTNGTTPSCTVNTYRPGKRLVGSITDSEQTLYNATFQSSQISCVGDTFVRAYTYNGAEDAARRKLVYGWTLVDVDENSDDPLMLFTLNGEFDGTTEIHDVKMMRGLDEQIIRMPFGCVDLLAADDKVYGFSKSGYVMIGHMGEQKVEAYQITLSFDTVYGLLDGGIAVLGNGSEIYMLSLEK
ncbi:MAG: hypothetical protein E7317_03365 [Clostridiales bacterium]|nr:hypothetical protein [Clostridiales bacterium]